MIKVAIVGLGRMGMLHLKDCLTIDGVEVVAAADSSKNSLNKAKLLGVEKLYTDYHDLYSHPSDMDAVVLSLPNFMHFDGIKLALEAGVNVFAEKPLATTVEECSEIVRLTEKSGKKLMVGHVMRFEEGIKKMKEKLSTGFIGDLEVATIEEIINGPFAHPRVPAPVSDWWFDPKKSGGGALLDIGYHMLDLYRFFAGESEVVFSHLNHRLNMQVEDGAIVILRSSKFSTKGIINVGWYQRSVFPKYNFRTLLHGTAGYLSSDDYIPQNPYTHAAKEGTKNILRRLVRKKIRYLSYTYHFEAFYEEMAHFIDCIQHDQQPSVTALDGLKTVELIWAAYAKSTQDLGEQR
jgi:myo-inositol 2-dehydrogenase/D-chiro-inositol 1-dehydrogenase